MSKVTAPDNSLVTVFVCDKIPSVYFQKGYCTPDPLLAVECHFCILIMSPIDGSGCLLPDKLTPFLVRSINIKQ